MTGEVLLVDDDTDLRVVVGVGLRAAGYGVREAGDGEHALRLLNQLDWLPDAVVLDMVMPVMDGFAFLDHKHRDPRLSPIPVLVISATVEGPVHGAVEVFRKPFDDADLLAGLARWIRAR